MADAPRSMAAEIMAYLSARGVRPTPHRYAVARYLAVHGVLDPERAVISLGDGLGSLNKALLRRLVETLALEGVLEPIRDEATSAYRLRPIKAWGRG